MSNIVCTLSQFLFKNCRKCENPSQWRCNDGGCIDKTKINNGIVDCLDGSDESKFANKLLR